MGSLVRLQLGVVRIMIFFKLLDLVVLYMYVDVDQNNLPLKFACVWCLVPDT